MIPGDGHGYGLGPSVVPNLEVIANWVERGQAPDKIIATKFVGDDPAKGILATRPLFPFPQVGVYAGAGDPDRAENFTVRQSSIDQINAIEPD